MKTERRHELQTNTLADWLGHQVDQVRPYSQWIGLGALVVVVAIAAGMVMSYRSESRLARGWTEYYSITSPEYRAQKFMALFEEINKDKAEAEQQRLTIEQQRDVTDEINTQVQTLADEYQGTPVGVAANLYLADFRRSRGVQLLYERDKVAAVTMLDQAVESYNQVLDQVKDPMLEARALYGLAQALESRAAYAEESGDNEDLTLAKQHYEKLAESSNNYDEVYASLARQQLQQIETRGFYAWFDQQLERDTESSVSPGGIFDRPGGGLLDGGGFEKPGGSLLPGTSFNPPTGSGSN